ncbi:MAG TPA: prepilin-type N-terminal cleavage/methylation domain-containing protein [Patescibacteria group bacterium]|nr:prepilin-type N-terminal cleavage/methylation domain-containing protein [Patescibacteria group bacterium]
MEGGTRHVRQAFTRRQHRLPRMFVEHRTDPGFTIVEVLIVLAITGLMFVSAATLISGKQNQTAFDQAAQQVESQIQQIINDVSIGYYPNNSDFACDGSNPATWPQISAGANQQGTNSGCILLGKAIQFQVQGTSPEEFAVMPIAGLQKNISGQDVQLLSEARPIAIDPSITQKALQSGLTTLFMYYNTGASNVNVGEVAFVGSLASYSGGAIVSGSQQVNVIPVDNTNLGANIPSTESMLKTKLPTSPINPKNGVSICFVSGTTNQSALIVIGGNRHTLGVTLTIKGNPTCT